MDKFDLGGLGGAKMKMDVEDDAQEVSIAPTSNNTFDTASADVVRFDTSFGGEKMAMEPPAASSAESAEIAAREPTVVSVHVWKDAADVGDLERALLGLEVLAGAVTRFVKAESPSSLFESLRSEPGFEGSGVGEGVEAVSSIQEEGSAPLWKGGTVADVLDALRARFLGGGARRLPQSVPREDGIPREPRTGGYDHDLIVIGGGSGGIAAAKEAASLGANVCLLDYVTPSPQGTRWGIGGTCVNVGCIPKKFMHIAATLGEQSHFHGAYGWSSRGPGSHSWETLRDHIQNHIASLNFGYRVELRDRVITYRNALGRLLDDHTVEVTDKQGKRSRITSARILIAVGGRPNQLRIPGGNLAITSDDIFSLDRDPGKTLCIGGGYIALETAGFLHGLGYPTTVSIYFLGGGSYTIKYMYIFWEGATL